MMVAMTFCNRPKPGVAYVFPLSANKAALDAYGHLTTNDERDRKLAELSKSSVGVLEAMMTSLHHDVVASPPNSCDLQASGRNGYSRFHASTCGNDHASMPADGVIA